MSVTEVKFVRIVDNRAEARAANLTRLSRSRVKMDRLQNTGDKNGLE